MDDPFARLGVERRPLLDEEALRERFHELSARLHPDVAGNKEGGEDFSAYTTAYQVLGDVRLRLRALLELETGGPLPRHQTIPEAIGTLFMEIGTGKQEVDRFLKQRTATASALAKAMLLDEGYQLAERCENDLARIESAREAVLERLPELDAQWQEGGRPLAAIGEAVQALGYLDKWSGQLREALIRLQWEE